MSYIVEQKIKGKIYLYRVESYWDKEKKQSRQKRTYIGPKSNNNKKHINVENINLVLKNYGNIYLLENISKHLGLSEKLEFAFPNIYREILALAFYEITEKLSSYLFHYWQEEHYLPNIRKLYSSEISELYEFIGISEKQRNDFIEQWIKHLNPINVVCYDITSISSYSKSIDFVEWGYNRDKEELPQINMGVMFCQNNLLPLFYSIYPGSIVDVTTLLNCIKYTNLYDLRNILLVLDRGFFSKTNILEMNNSKNKINFIQPISFSLKSAKEIVQKNRKKLSNPIRAFKYNEEILSHFQTTITIEEHIFDAHIFFNEKLEVDQKHHFYSNLFEIENKFENIKINSLKEYSEYKKSNIPTKYIEYFKWNKEKKIIERNTRTMNLYTSKMGTFIIITNQKGLSKNEVLNYYRQRDHIEKAFDIFKNEMNGNRLRGHSQYNINGRLFIKFISLIIYAEISKIMIEKKLFDTFSFREMLMELKKIKIIKIGDNLPFLSELSKKQKIILDAFGYTEEIKHSY
jgi:transposase